MKNKRVLSLLCVLALIMTLASSITYAATPEEDSANALPRCYTTQATSLYASKNINGTVLRNLSGGQELIMLTTLCDNGWLHVRTTDGVTGYVLCKHIIRPN